MSSHDVKEPLVIDMDALRFSPTAVLFEGAQFGGIQATSFIVSSPPGVPNESRAQPLTRSSVMRRAQSL